MSTEYGRRESCAGMLRGLVADLDGLDATLAQLRAMRLRQLSDARSARRGRGDSGLPPVVR